MNNGHRTIGANNCFVQKKIAHSSIVKQNSVCTSLKEEEEQEWRNKQYAQIEINVPHGLGLRWCAWMAS